MLVKAYEHAQTMFALADHRIHLDAEQMPRDISAHEVRNVLKGGASCRPPVYGTVYGVLLNDRAGLDALGHSVNAAPYKAPPQAPILYMKPRNSLAGHRANVAVPDDEVGVQVGGSLGIVIGRTASQVSVEGALDFVAGYTTVADLCIPHTSIYRPSVRLRARDGFCVVGPALVARRHVGIPDDLDITVTVAGQPGFNATTATSIRSVARLLADVTEFMTLAAGDILTMGVPHGSPIAHRGDEVVISIGAWAPLNVSFVGNSVRVGEKQ